MNDIVIGIDGSRIGSLAKPDSSGITGDSSIEKEHNQGHQQDDRNRLEQSSQGVGDHLTSLLCAHVVDLNQMPADMIALNVIAHAGRREVLHVGFDQDRLASK